MQIFDRYLFRNLLIATVFTAVTLTCLILLTQSLKFLELIINAGASGTAFWILTLMALPRFFEIIMPVALMAATIFIYNRMATDSELIVMRATGSAPLRLARPALLLSLLMALALLCVTVWVAPASQRGMNQFRQVIKAQYSTLLFREGVFNAVRPGLTVFIRERASDGRLHGVVIHDSRPETKTPATVMAKSGIVVATAEGQQVLVYDGSRQSLNPDTRALERLNFERYTIDLPEGSGPVRERWREPDERSFAELLRPDLTNLRDKESRDDFKLEIQRRLISPFLAPAYTVLALLFLLLGPVSRRAQPWRIVMAIGAVIAMQGLFLATISLSRQSAWGIVLMYLTVFLPLAGGLFLLSEPSLPLRHRIAQHPVWQLTGRRKGSPQ
ncbi:MAG TPA: LPS export ABC transporter permease LptF [Alphaproteobacteria bacterium]|jgi:lipopolysaccharide export system permease protein